ncbi:MAG TPA: nucleotidyltransferase domain-containing protein [Rhodanobacteraceae bacterium]
MNIIAATVGLCHIPTMRLTDQQVQTIRHLIAEGYGADARVRLFGSRTNDAAIGGDVDLLIELPAKAPLTHQIAVSARLEQQLGMPVDVLTTWPGQRSRPIVEVARLTGVWL